MAPDRSAQVALSDGGGRLSAVEEVPLDHRRTYPIEPAEAITTLKVRTATLNLPDEWAAEMHAGAVFHVRLTLHVDRAEQPPSRPPFWSARWLEVVREISE
jgi:hypothetical protein